MHSALDHNYTPYKVGPTGKISPSNSNSGGMANSLLWIYAAIVWLNEE